MELWKYSWERQDTPVYEEQNKFYAIIYNHQLESWTVLINMYNTGYGITVPSLLLTDDFQIFTLRSAIPFYYDGNDYCTGVHLIFDSDISKWILCYFGPQGGGGESIAFATGNDIDSLANIHTDYVLKPNISPAPNGSVSLFPAGFMKVDSTYWLAVNISYTATNRVYETRLYSSTDLINWTAHGIMIPANSGDWDESSNYNGNWIVDNGIYHYFYGGNKGGYSLDRKLGLAISDTINGTYQKMGMILNPPNEAKNPLPFFNPFTNQYELYWNEAEILAGPWTNYKALTYTNMGKDTLRSVEITEDYLKSKKVFKAGQFTTIEVGALTPDNGDIIYLTDTDATFTSVGFWGYENGSWVKI